MENKKYKFFQAPFLSFFDADLYRDVANNWKGCGALYIFLFSSAAWLISFLGGYALPLTQAMNNEDFKAFVNQVPHMEITDGKATMDKHSPYEILDSRTKVPMVRFDMDRKSDTMINGDPVVVVTSTAVITRAESTPGSGVSASEDAGTKPLFLFSSLGKSNQKIEFDGGSLKALVSTLATWVPIAILFSVWPFVFLGHLIQLLVYGGIGMLIASMMNKEITFEKAMRLAAIAISPSIVICILLTLMQWSVTPARMLLGFWGLASIAVSITYLILIMRALPAPGATTTAELPL